MNNHFPKVSLQLSQISSSAVQVDVLIDHIPEHFLGIAFDLVSDSNQCHYQKFTKGGIFKSPEEVLALALKKDEPERVVFGLTLKRGFSIDATEGVVASFSFECEGKGDMNMHFSHGVVSVFDGQRKDLADVLWQPAVFSLQGNQGELNLLPEQRTQAQIFHNAEGFASFGASSLQNQRETSSTSSFFGLPQPLEHLYLFFAVLFAIFLLTGAIWLVLKKCRKR